MKIDKRALVNAVVCLLVGGAVGVYVGSTNSVSCDQSWSKRKAGGREAALLAKFTDELDLDQQQQAEVKRILSNQGVKARSLFIAVRPELDEIRKETHAQIRETLRAEQLPRFNELKQRMEEYRQKHRERTAESAEANQ